MADLPWRKIYCNTIRSDKFEEIFAYESNPIVIAYAWMTMILIASDTGRLVRPNGNPHNIDTLAIALRMNKEDCEHTVSVLTDYKMLEEEDGLLVIRNFEEYQQIEKANKVREQTRERVNRWRKKGAEKVFDEPEPEKEDVKEETEEEAYSREQREKDFNTIYKIYPKKGGRAEAFDRYSRWVSKTGFKINNRYYKATPKEVWIAVKRYIASREEENTELKYYKGFNVLLGKSLLDYLGDEENE